MMAVMRGTDVRVLRAGVAGLILVLAMTACSPGAPTSTTSSSPAQSESPSSSPSAPTSETPAPTPTPTPTDLDPGLPGTEVQLAVSRTSGAGGQISVRAFIVDVVESGGTCTLTMRHGSVERTAEAAAVADASTTICGPLTIRDVVSGAWDGTVSYTSPSAHGEVDVEVVVP